MDPGEVGADRLVVTFPRRLARLGLLIFGALFALFAGWIHQARDGEMPWLAVVAGTGCFLVMLMSLGQLVRPRVLAEVDRQGLTLHRRRLQGGRSRIEWPEVREMAYMEKEVDRFLHKVIRLRLTRPVEPGLRLFRDEDDVAHLDAFAAEPGGEGLLEKLKRLRTSSEPPG